MAAASAVAPRRIRVCEHSAARAVLAVSDERAASQVADGVDGITSRFRDGLWWLTGIGQQAPRLRLALVALACFGRDCDFSEPLAIGRFEPVGFGFVQSSLALLQARAWPVSQPLTPVMMASDVMVIAFLGPISEGRSCMRGWL